MAEWHEGYAKAMEHTHDTLDQLGVPREANGAKLYIHERIRAMRPRWRTVAEDGPPPCDGHTTYIGINSAGYACCFNAMRGGLCVMETAEGTYGQMSDLRDWRLLDRPARTPGVTVEGPQKCARTDGCPGFDYGERGGCGGRYSDVPVAGVVVQRRGVYRMGPGVTSGQGGQQHG